MDRLLPKAVTSCGPRSGRSRRRRSGRRALVVRQLVDRELAVAIAERARPARSNPATATPGSDQDPSRECPSAGQKVTPAAESSCSSSRSSASFSRVVAVYAAGVVRGQHEDRRVRRKRFGLRAAQTMRVPVDLALDDRSRYMSQRSSTITQTRPQGQPLAAFDPVA